MASKETEVVELGADGTIYLKASGFEEFPYTLEDLGGFVNKIENINLGNNKITEIPAWLEDLENLNSLELGTNRISDISILNNFAHLLNLDLGDNAITDVSGIVDLLNRIKHIGLGSCKIVDFSAVENSKTIRGVELDLTFHSDIKLEKIVKLTNLNINASDDVDKVVDFSKNIKIKKLYFSNRNYDEDYVKKLLSDELMNILAGYIDQLVDLKNMFLDGEIAQRMSFSKIKKLVDVYIMGGEFDEIPYNLFENYDMEEFALNYSNISNISEDIKKWNKIKVLELNGNKNIRELPLSILDLTSLQTLNIEYTNIKYIPDALALMPNIQKLDFQGLVLDENCLFANYDLLGVYKLLKGRDKEKVRVGILEIPNVLRGALQEYLVYFDEYYEEISGKKLGFSVAKHSNGLKIEVDLEDGIDIEHVNSVLSNYTQYLVGKNIEDIDDDAEVDKLVREFEFLKLRVSLKVDRFKQEITILQTENKILKSDKENLQEIIMKLAEKPNIISINQNNTPSIKHRILNENNNVMNIDIDLKPFKDLGAILNEYDEGVEQAVRDIEMSVIGNKRSSVSDAITNFLGKVSFVVEKAHVALVDAPEVLVKIKGALLASKAVLIASHYNELATLVDKVLHMI